MGISLRTSSSDDIVEIVHLMFMGYAGRRPERQHDLDCPQLAQQAEDSLQAIHTISVLSMVTQCPEA